MITEITVSVKRGPRTTATLLAFEKVGPDELAVVEDVAHALMAHVERLSREKENAG